MASFMIRRVLQRSFSQTSFQNAIQRQIIQEDGKIYYFLKSNLISMNYYRYNFIEKRN